jgi:hypothetical protein
MSRGTFIGDADGRNVTTGVSTAHNNRIPPGKAGNEKPAIARGAGEESTRLRSGRPVETRGGRKSGRCARNFRRKGPGAREMTRQFPKNALDFSSFPDLEKWRQIGLCRIKNRARNGGRGIIHGRVGQARASSWCVVAIRFRSGNTPSRYHATLCERRPTDD